MIKGWFKEKMLALIWELSRAKPMGEGEENLASLPGIAALLKQCVGQDLAQ